MLVNIKTTRQSVFFYLDVFDRLLIKLSSRCLQLDVSTVTTTFASPTVFILICSWRKYSNLALSGFRVKHNFCINNYCYTQRSFRSTEWSIVLSYREAGRQAGRQTDGSREDFPHDAQDSPAPPRPPNRNKIEVRVGIQHSIRHSASQILSHHRLIICTLLLFYPAFQTSSIGIQPVSDAVQLKSFASVDMFAHCNSRTCVRRSFLTNPNLYQSPGSFLTNPSPYQSPGSFSICSRLTSDPSSTAAGDIGKSALKGI